MNQFGAFLVLIALAAVVLAALGGVVAWYNQEGRRIRRGLRRVLQGETHALIVAHGRGAGFNFTSNTMAVTWDTGAWCLIYQIDELVGAELVIDNQVAARSFRGEPRRPLDLLGGAEKQVVLRLVFDDPQYPDFDLSLWSEARADRRGEPKSAEAVEDANRWLARVESIFRRKPAAVARVAGSASASVGTPAPRELKAEAPPQPKPGTPPPPTDSRQELPFAGETDEVDDDHDDEDEPGDAAAR